MKKRVITLCLACLFVFASAFPAFAGDIPISGRSCPSGQTCFSSDTQVSKTDTPPITKWIWEYFSGIFG